MTVHEQLLRGIESIREIGSRAEDVALSLRLERGDDDDVVYDSADRLALSACDIYTTAAELRDLLRDLEDGIVTLDSEAEVEFTV
jgi:hypothetical protein